MGKKSIKLVPASFGFAIVLLCGIAIASFQTIQRLQENYRWQAHTYQVMISLGDLEYDLINTENERRNYILTGNIFSLNRYNYYRQISQKVWQKLQKLTQNNPLQQSSLQEIKPIYQRILTLLNKTKPVKISNSFRSISQDSLPVKTIIESTKLRQQITAITARMRAEEEKLLNQRIRHTVITVNLTIIVTAISSIF